jgi:solute carrier family 25 (mitochondrial folate transporter), member 32
MQKRHALPLSLVETIAGFSAGIVSTLAVHPLDIVKTRLQVDSRVSSRFGSSLRVARSIARNEGVLRGFYRGLTPNIVGNSVSWGLYFLWYGKIKEELGKWRGDGKLGGWDYFVASGAAGMVLFVEIEPILM